MLQNVVEYLRQHQQDIPESLVKDADWYVAPEPAPAPADDQPHHCGCDAHAAEAGSGAACWTPPLM
jgi:hypothetical protein